MGKQCRNRTKSLRVWSDDDYSNDKPGDDYWGNNADDSDLSDDSDNELLHQETELHMYVYTSDVVFLC